MLGTRVILVALASLALLWTVAPLASAETPTEGTVAVTLTTVTTKGAPDGRTAVSVKGNPGQEFKDQVLLENSGTVAIKVQLSGTDAFNGPQGEYWVLEPGQPAVRAGTWVSFAGKPTLQVDLAPGRTTVVPFSVTIPVGSMPGDHPAAVLATVVQPRYESGGVRAHVPVRVRVSGPTQPNLTISSFDAHHEGSLNPVQGSLSTTASITNNGNVALTGVVTLKATTWFGSQVRAPFTVDVAELLPGATREVTIDLPDVGSVGYAVVDWSLRPAGDLGPDAAEVVPVGRRSFVWAIPWPALGALALVAALWLTWPRVRRRLPSGRAAGPARRSVPEPTALLTAAGRR